MKTKTLYLCQQCGQQYGKWVGRCQECGAWNSVVEELAPTKGGGHKRSSSQSAPQPIDEIAAETVRRLSSGMGEFDGVLGGGLVPETVILLGGEPGIGKSTLLLQVAALLANQSQKVLYVSGEESANQIAVRSQRLKVKTKDLFVVSETNLEAILGHVNLVQPKLLIIDSIQTTFNPALESQLGSVGQIRECAFRLIELAKSSSITTFLVGHVTKEGSIAGPKILEHMVDVVLSFENTAAQNFRLLRTVKNRFGSTNEIGVFEMVTEGMREVPNPSELFLMERAKTIPGSAITASLEGTRPILVEVQALLSTSPLPMPRRTAMGFDPNRISLLVAILEKRGGFRLYDQDVYVNIAGGLRIQEPAADLGVVGAMLSSFTGKPIDPKTVLFGEVGLGGEIRAVSRSELRLKEAARIGFTKALVPLRVAKELGKESSIELLGLEHVGQLTDSL